jgi:hypothetical protein
MTFLFLITSNQNSLKLKQLDTEMHRLLKNYFQLVNGWFIIRCEELLLAVVEPLADM